MSKHLLEIAKALVRVKAGKVEVLTDPKIHSCPLRKDLYGITRESRETVARVLQEQMQEMGMYGPDRVLELHEKPVSFGASEILSDAIAEGIVDAAVIVCDGAGTVIVSKPEVLQAIGAHMTGLIQTEPIKEIQDGLEKSGCLILDREGSVDQVQGLKKAIAAGFKKIAVTIAGPSASDAKKIREQGQVSDVRPILLAVHTTGISEVEANVLAKSCDLIWSCASKEVRDIAGKRSKIQIGISIPVFALTDEGKRLVLNRAQHFQGSLVIHRAILPVAPEGKQPKPLI
jgi:putative methanogenesis marker protein 8